MKVLSVVIMIWIFYLLSLVFIIKAFPAEPPKVGEDVLLERKGVFQSEMRRLDAEWKLIPYQYREFEEKIRVIDQELAKRKEAQKKTP